MKKTASKTKPTKVVSTLSLARYLGLSEWTVSRAINGHPEVKAATRERILQAMKDVGFRPNPVARGLSGKAMGIVGVCFGNANSGIMIDKITLLDEFLRRHQLRGMLSISTRDEESELRILSDFLHLRVDAIVLIQSVLSTNQLRDTLGDALCVHVDPSIQDIFPRVSLDRKRAMHLIVNHLVELGHRSLGTLGFSSTHRWRWEGLVQSLCEHGLSPEENLQVFELEDYGAESYLEGIQLAKRALAAKKPPTAFIAMNDRIAAGAMQEMRDAGFRIPEDFSVVGFDNLTVGRHLRPMLTTIDQQTQLMISHAGQMLLEQLGKASGSSLGKSVNVEPRLIVRESTGPAPKRSKR